MRLIERKSHAKSRTPGLGLTSLRDDFDDDALGTRRRRDRASGAKRMRGKWHRGGSGDRGRFGGVTLSLAVPKVSGQARDYLQRLQVMVQRQGRVALLGRGIKFNA
jgi:hypothetical protein